MRHVYSLALPQFCQTIRSADIGKPVQINLARTCDPPIAVFGTAFYTTPNFLLHTLSTLVLLYVWLVIWLVGGSISCCA